MAQQRFSSSSLSLSSTAMTMTLIICLALGLGQVFLIALNPIIGLLGALGIILIVLLFMQSEIALPLYILMAGPCIVFSASSSGIMSRLYIGDVLFILIVGLWLLYEMSSKRKTTLERRELRILVPLLCLAFLGFLSIVYSRMFPDRHVTYAFVHSNVSLSLVNAVEMGLLIGLPLFIVIVPKMVRTLRDAKWMIWAYQLVGLPYALGTIFAGPLHLYSQDVILGVQRPLVLGTSSSGLGILNVLFTCLSLGQMLYARQRATRLRLGLLTCIYAGGVAMAFGRESWLGLIIGIWVILGLRYKNPIALLIPLALLPLVPLFFPSITNFFNPAKVYGADRLNIWQDAIVIWLRSPYMGIGAGNFQFFDIAYGTEVVGVAHNQFLEVLAEMGVQGLVCLLLAIIMMGRVAFERFNTAVSDLGKGIALAYLGYFAALVFASFFTSLFVPSADSGGGTGAFIVSSYPWLFLGLVLSIPNWDHEATALDTPTELYELADMNMQHKKVEVS